MPLDLPPLPLELGAAAREAFGSATTPLSANPSLVWSRYPRLYSATAPARSRERKEFLSAFVAGYERLGARHGPLLADLLGRLERVSDERFDLRSTGPFASGLGQDHPVENGFSFDPLTGVPFLAGSALKGLARASARLLGEPADLVSRALGSPPPAWGASGDALAPGELVFLGAWPTSWPKLKVEILNPHHESYQKDQGRPAADRTRLPSYADEPVPVTFLTVAPGTRFRVFLGLTARAERADLALVRRWLQVGFDWQGAGAKTSSGFGRMAPG